MIDDQIEALKIAAEVLQSCGIMRNKPITKGRELEELLLALGKFKSNQNLTEAGYIILPFEDEDKLADRLQRFIGLPNISWTFTARR